MDELAELIANTHARWMPRVVEAIFGTNDPVSVAEELSEAVAAALAVPVVAAQFYEPGVGVVVGLDLADGRAVVAKVHRATFMPLEHGRCLVAARTLMLHYAQDQLAKLPTEIRDQLPTTGKIESRLRKLEAIDTTIVSTPAGAYRLSWFLPLIDQDRAARRQIRALERRIDELLDARGTTLLAEVGDPFRFARESKFARWSGTGAVALSSGEGDGPPVRHRLDFRGNRRINSVLYIASVAQQRDHDAARTYINRKTTEGKTRREARRAHNATSPTASSAACGPTNAAEQPLIRSLFDKGASDSPPEGRQRDPCIRRARGLSGRECPPCRWSEYGSMLPADSVAPMAGGASMEE